MGSVTNCNSLKKAWHEPSGSNRTPAVTYNLQTIYTKCITLRERERGLYTIQCILYSVYYTAFLQ